MTNLAIPQKFAALTHGGHVLFTFEATCTFEARKIVKRLRTDADIVTGIRLARPNDVGMDEPIAHRGASTPQQVGRG